MPLPSDKLAGEFKSHLAARDLDFDEATILDALAAYLSSQFVMFAGPSGTGKSSLARALATFFTDRFMALEAEVGLTRPADFVGYPSSITGSPEYVTTPATDLLLALPSGGASPLSPAILVEEANLSVIEGYLAPLTHALSGLAIDTVSWPLHQHSTHLQPRGGAGSATVPPALELSPFPRLLATLNVDATAHAPANKVVARSTVLLLDSPEIERAVATNPASTPPASTAPPGHGIAEHPADCLLAARQAGTDAGLRTAFRDAATASLGERRRVSPRMAQRALQYMAAYELVAKGAADADRTANAIADAAENALLHFVLPVLDAREFMVIAVRAGSAAREGGLLANRLERLSPADEEWAVSADDFWTGLS